MAFGDFGSMTYKSPNFPPYNDPNFKGLWIFITAYPLKELTAFADNETGGLKVGTDEVTVNWEYLAPEQIMENINHTWEPWETISSRLAGAAKKGKELVKEASGLIDAATATGKGILTGKNIRALGSEIFDTMGGVTKTKAKIDTPLAYENTARREYTLQFNLTASNKKQAENMMMGVRQLEQLSTPTKTGRIGIELPHVFSLKCKPENIYPIFMDCEFMALSSIQPTYKAPYDEEGWPMLIELSLTFKELPPLYSDSFI